MVLRILICDDDVKFAGLLAEDLRALFRTLPEGVRCEIGPTFDSAKPLIEHFASEPADILFLDIDMPRLNGFDAASVLNAQYPNTVILFVSAHDSFVYESFAYSPFRFLRKSHLKEELPSAFRSAVDKCARNVATVTFHTREGAQTVRVKDVLYLESRKNYYTVYTLTGAEIRCRGTLSAAGEMLAEHDFFRTHAAFLVNLEWIDSIRNRTELIMKNGHLVPISLQRHEAFYQRYSDFMRRRMLR